VAVPNPRHRSVPRLRLVDAAVSTAPSEVASHLRASPGPLGPQGSSAPTEVGELDDAQLVSLVRVGDRGALDALYRRHAPYVLSLAVRIQGHVTDVEDIVHDAFLRVVSRLEELRQDDAFRPWLASVTANLVKSRLRRRRFLGALGLAGTEPVDLDALVGESAGPETRAQLAEVYGVLRLLPVDQRVAWVLRHVEGHKLEEVARILDCSLATAKRRLGLAQQAVLASGTPGGRR
jgi:RNA polymerase sigma-70 factor, ECF subfamily